MTPTVDTISDTIADTIPIACEITPAERARLVRLCLRFTRDPDVAEDLAQETLVVAWRQWHKLRDAANQRARASWLAAIAAHICHRWARWHGRETARFVGLEARIDDAGLPDWLADDADLETELETELERGELLALLEKALALLPPQTRTLLLARYLHETPPAEIAARHGLSEGALFVRLHRGRLALRRLLSTTLRADAAAYGLVAEAEHHDWQETRIWCPSCGQIRLQGQLDPATAHLVLRCPRCAGAHGELLDHVSYQGLLVGVKTFKAALNRVMAWADPYYRRGVASREVICHRCGRPAPILLVPLPGTPESRRAEPGLHAACSCPAQNNSSLTGIALYTPEGRRFWREHPRIRLAPLRSVEACGREAIVVGYESVAGFARIDTLFACDTFELLATHTAPGA